MNEEEAKRRLKVLDDRLGLGVGATKERAKLHAVIYDVNGKLRNHRKKKLGRKYKVK